MRTHAQNVWKIN